VSLEPGVRITVDQGSATERPFVNCFANGCFADYDAGTELVDQLKQGQTVAVQAVDRASSSVSLTVPLAGFDNAYDGPPQEPKVFEEVLSTEEIQARLDRDPRAEEERNTRCAAR
jgi:invasion protein IalB